MKKRLLSFLFVSFLFALGCSKDDPLPIEKQTKLLAGVGGQSKTWLLVGGSIVDNQGTLDLSTLIACFLDNEYIFSNTAAQAYSCTEGATKCDPADPQNIESGTWFLSIDGKSFSITVDLVGSPNSSLFSYFPFTADVQTLTDTDMTLYMEGDFGGSLVKVTLNFIKKV